MPKITKAPSKRVNRPALADPDWHPIAKTWYDSLAKSGQSEFYQASDWAFAYSLAEDLSDYKRQTKRSAVMLSSIMTGMTLLLTTEGDRRRVNIELHEPEQETGVAKAAVNEYMELLKKKPAA
jgi:hypothetical protein